MPTFTTECQRCKKEFKSLYSLNKHVRERHQGVEESVIPVFKDSKGDETPLPKPRENLDQGSKEGYRMWLDGLIERMNSTFHPRLPGRWVKIETHQVPSKYFEYFIGKANVQVNAVREVCHKAQPNYRSSTRRISYKIFDIDQFIDALEETSVPFDVQVLYSGNTVCEEEEEVGPLSAEEEIARAKERVHAGQKRKRPSSKSTFNCWIWGRKSHQRN